jgi:hypothetical protein
MSLRPRLSHCLHEISRPSKEFRDEPDRIQSPRGCRLSELRSGDVRDAKGISSHRRKYESRLVGPSAIDVSDFVGKLSTARLIPDATSACQECAARQFEMFAEDGRRLWTDSQKLIETGMRIFSGPVASS